MQISTTARHCELDPEVRLFAQNRIEKLSRYGRDIREAHLIVTAEGYRFQAEVTLRLKGPDLVGREEATEARVAVDRAVDRLEAQLRKLKERRVDRKRSARPLNGKLDATDTGEGSPEGEGDVYEEAVGEAADEARAGEE